MAGAPELTMHGTPAVPTGLTPTPVIDSLLEKMTNPSLDGLLSAMQNVALALDLKDIGTGLLKGNMGDLAKGLIGVADEVEKLVSQQAALQASEQTLDESISMSM